jgi:hypothetical protein
VSALGLLGQLRRLLERQEVAAGNFSALDFTATEVIRNRRGREVKAGIPHSSGVGQRGFDPRQLRRTKRAFLPPLAI